MKTSLPFDAADSALLPPAKSGPRRFRANREGIERVRKPLALACVVAWLGAALLLPSGHGTALELAALVGHLFVATAVAGRLWSTLHIGGHKNGHLCRSGPYALTRNPLYFFSWLGVTGLALLMRQPWLVVGAWAGFALSFLPLIRAEERRLAILFGDDFRDYLSRVPRFFPRLRAAPTGAEVEPLNPARMGRVENAIADAVWFLVAAAVLEAAVRNGLWSHLQKLAHV